MYEIECPYCEADCGFPDENTEEGELQEWDCKECDKSFVYSCSYSTTYHSDKADCLNGAEHKFEKIVGIPKEVFIDKYQCKDCGKRKAIKGKDLENDGGKK